MNEECAKCPSFATETVSTPTRIGNYCSEKFGSGQEIRILRIVRLEYVRKSRIPTQFHLGEVRNRGFLYVPICGRTKIVNSYYFSNQTDAQSKYTI